MKIVKEVNGVSYTFDLGRNCMIAEQIKGDYDGYSLTYTSDGFNPTIFIKNRSFFDKEFKNTGILFYDHDKDVVTYKKYGFKKETHEFKTTGSIGLNWDILSNLTPKDKVVVESIEDEKKINYLISVNKVIKMQNFRYFKSKGYEKQIFIPILEFKREETNRSKSVRDFKRKKTVKQRKADNRLDT